MPQKENIDIDFSDLVSRSEIATEMPAVYNANPSPAIYVAEADTFYVVLNDYPHRINGVETIANALARLKAAGFVEVGIVLID